MTQFARKIISYIIAKVLYEAEYPELFVKVERYLIIQQLTYFFGVRLPYVNNMFAGGVRKICNYLLTRTILNLDMLSEEDKLEMIAVLTLAGFETTFNSLLHLIHAILTNQHVEEYVRNGGEMRNLIKEVGMHYPAVAMPLVRCVPNDMTINGIYLPKGTTVDVPIPYVNKNILATTDHPESIRPERHIENTSLPSLTFSKSSRDCMGQRFAEQMLTEVVTFLFKKYEIELVNAGKRSYGLASGRSGIVVKMSKIEKTIHPMSENSHSCERCYLEKVPKLDFTRLNELLKINPQHTHKCTLKEGTCDFVGAKSKLYAYVEEGWTLKDVSVAINKLGCCANKTCKPSLEKLSFKSIREDAREILDNLEPKLEDDDMKKVSSYLHEVEMDEGIECTARWTAALLTLAKSIEHVYLNRIRGCKSYRGDTVIMKLREIDSRIASDIIVDKRGGNVFDRCPELKGSVFVGWGAGESCPRMHIRRGVSGFNWLVNYDGNPLYKPSYPQCEWGVGMNIAGKMCGECWPSPSDKGEDVMSFPLAFFAAISAFGVILDIPSDAAHAAWIMRIVATTMAFCNIFDLPRDAAAGKSTCGMLWLRGVEASRAFSFLDTAIQDKSSPEFLISVCIVSYILLGKRHDFGLYEHTYRINHSLPPISDVTVFVDNVPSKVLTSWAMFFLRPDLRCSPHNCSFSDVSLRGTNLAGGYAVAHLWENSEYLAQIKSALTHSDPRALHCRWNRFATANFNPSR